MPRQKCFAVGLNTVVENDDDESKLNDAKKIVSGTSAVFFLQQDFSPTQ